MGRYKSKGDHGEIEFVRAAYDTFEDTASECGVSLKHSVWPTEQRGVLAFVSAARVVGSAADGRPVVTLTSYWPSATDLSWAAFWFQHSFKLARMVEGWKLAEDVRVNGTQQG